MRTLRLLLTFTSITSFASVWLGATPPAFAQVSDAERAGARELFKEGDQLQRAGHFAEALDKFQRAQQVFPAPTNLLRIAECDAALGHLVESAEAYREVLRSPLPAGAPPAFQAAVDQAKAELSQVEPRVPRLVVQVQPAGVQNPQMQIDGQNVSGALLGEPMSLDAGVHKVAVLAPGYATTEQEVELKEHESKTVALTLNPAAGGAALAATPGGPPGAPPPPPPVLNGTPPPPPPPIVETDLGPSQPLRSRVGLLFGLHLGFEGAGGSVPAPNTTGSVDASDVSAGGVAFGVDGGLRFARHWYVGLTLDHALLNSGNSSNLQSDVGSNVTGATANTTQLGIILALIGNPERVSFYGEVGLADRWFNVRETLTGGTSTRTYTGGEFMLGIGVWIPVGRAVRLLPKITLGLGSLGSGNQNATGSNGNQFNGYDAFATFAMLGLAGFYNLDL
jgi:hypothetical protein